MNLDFEIIPERPDSIPYVTAKIRARGGEFRGTTRGLLSRALEAGRIEALWRAPRGNSSANRGRRVRDSIYVNEYGYSPGGAGGGGLFSGTLGANAPQLRYVMQGTADQGRGLIRPARGNVMVLDKGGEGVRFRPWVHGQRANTFWWDEAHRAVQFELEYGLKLL